VGRLEEGGDVVVNKRFPGNGSMRVPLREIKARAGYTLVLTRGRTETDAAAENVLRDYRARDTAEKLFDAFKTDHQFVRGVQRVSAGGLLRNA
jgi:hypothetical protein